MTSCFYLSVIPYWNHIDILYQEVCSSITNGSTLQYYLNILDFKNVFFTFCFLSQRAVQSDSKGESILLVTYLCFFCLGEVGFLQQPSPQNSPHCEIYVGSHHMLHYWKYLWFNVDLMYLQSNFFHCKSAINTSEKMLFQKKISMTGLRYTCLHRTQMHLRCINIYGCC